MKQLGWGLLGMLIVLLVCLMGWVVLVSVMMGVYVLVYVIETYASISIPIIVLSGIAVGVIVGLRREHGHKSEVGPNR